MQKLKEMMLDKYKLPVKNQNILNEAFTHSSYSNEHRPAKNNEKLEFLGDAVLELNISDFLYKNFPDLDEGQLTKLRAEIVQTKSFARFSRQMGLDKFLKLGKGEEKNGSRNKDTVLENLFEAFMGYVYLDFGNPGVQIILKKEVFPIIESGFFNERHDYKTILQEELQRNGAIKIEYRTIEEKPDASETKYTVSLEVEDKSVTTGSGRNKKQAQQNAALHYLEMIGKKGEI